MSDYTPGPWKLADTIGDGIKTPKRRNIRPVDDRDGMHGAIAYVYGDSSPECRANARLIVAAPELAAALEVAREFVEFCWRDVALNEYAEEQREQAERLILAALAKARGERLPMHIDTDAAGIRSPFNACCYREACRELLLALQLILENPDHELLPTERADGEAAIAKAIRGTTDE